MDGQRAKNEERFVMKNLKIFKTELYGIINQLQVEDLLNSVKHPVPFALFTNLMKYWS